MRSTATSRASACARAATTALVLVSCALMMPSARAADTPPDTPSLVLETYLRATLNFRFEEAYRHLSDRDKRGLTVEEYTRRGRQMNALIVLLSQETDFRVIAERVEGPTAEVEVEMASPSFENLEVFERQLRAQPELKAQKDYEAQVQKELIRAVKSGVVPKTKELHRYRLLLEAGSWKVSLKG